MLKLMVTVALSLGLVMTGADDADSQTVRVATFNASLNRSEADGLIASLSTQDEAQIARVAETIQRVNPDILLINEFDYDADHRALDLFREAFLAVGQNGAPPVVYAHVFAAPSNTGVPTGVDLDRDGGSSGPGDAQGFGFFPGQFGMALLSKFPIDEDAVRTFQRFLWRDMPDALLPTDPETGEGWYDDEALAVLRLSSKSHWDVPVNINGRRLRLLTSHPTPPVFDGPEDRNGRRNHDEIRFWADYIGGAGYMVDDADRAGGLDAGADFVLMGDLNADPADGDGIRAVINSLLADPLLQDALPRSDGGNTAAVVQGGSNADQAGDPAFDTADFDDAFAGNLRVDYVLPSAGLEVVDSGVFWPMRDDLLAYLNEASDHRLVWVDLRLE